LHSLFLSGKLVYTIFPVSTIDCRIYPQSKEFDVKAKRTSLAKALIGAVLGAATLLGASAQAKEWKTVTIALEGSYAPWNLTLPGGKLGGFEPELIANLCDRVKLQCKLVAQDWDGMIPGLLAGKFDVLMDAISITPEREKIIAFSRPYAATPATFAVTDTHILPKSAPDAAAIKLVGDAKSDKPTVEGLRKQLKGKTIGIQSGTVYTKFIEENFKDIASIRVYKTSPERDLDLANGRIDASFDDVTYYVANTTTKETASIVMAGPKIGGSIWGPGEGLAFRKQDNDLKTKFDTAVNAALADGTVKKLSEKWFKTNVAP
jgi:octopine/nopaline transport system substrate-binding protein